MGDPSLRPSALAADPGGDLALIRRCQRRDPAAFGELYEKYADRVYRHIYYFLRDRAEAEDLTAETFLRAWAAVDRYQWRGKPVLSWLLTIAHNLVVSRLETGVEGRGRPEGGLPDGRRRGPTATAAHTGPAGIPEGAGWRCRWQDRPLAAWVTVPCGATRLHAGPAAWQTDR